MLILSVILSSNSISGESKHDRDFLVLANKTIIPEKESGVIFVEFEKVKFSSSQNIFAILEPLGKGGIPVGAKMSVRSYHVLDEMVTLADSKSKISKGERMLSLGSKFARYSPQMNVAVLASGLKIGTKYRIVVTIISESEQHKTTNSVEPPNPLETKP